MPRRFTEKEDERGAAQLSHANCFYNSIMNRWRPITAMLFCCVLQVIVQTYRWWPIKVIFCFLFTNVLVTSSSWSCRCHGSCDSMKAFLFYYPDGILVSLALVWWRKYQRVLVWQFHEDSMDTHYSNNTENTIRVFCRLSDFSIRISGKYFWFLFGSKFRMNQIRLLAIVTIVLRSLQNVKGLLHPQGRASVTGRVADGE